MAEEMMKEELQQIDVAPEVTPEVLKLDGYRITSQTVVPEEEFLFRMFGTPCFPRRDMTTITGQEKCGKTFFSSMLMACCAEKKVLELERIREEPLKVVWFDTEQSQQSTNSILKKRVVGLVNEKPFPEQQFYVFNVRSCTYQERMEMLITAVSTYRPDLVIVDNISDLLSSINDMEESQRVITQLMQLSTEYDCNVTVVIHLNKSGEKRNLRGWLGTELLHKSFEVYYCEHLAESNVFSVEQTMTRKYNIGSKLYYEVTEEGLPVCTNRARCQPRDEHGKFVSMQSSVCQMPQVAMEKFNQEYIIRHPDNAKSPWEWDLRRLYADTFRDRHTLGMEDLKRQVMSLAGIQYGKYYDKVFRLALSNGVVKTTYDTLGRVLVLMP